MAIPSNKSEVFDTSSMSPGAIVGLKQAIANAAGVTGPKEYGDNRAWLGTELFANALVIFVTLDKSGKPANERYSDWFDGGRIRWETKASASPSTPNCKWIIEAENDVYLFCRMLDRTDFNFIGRVEHLAHTGTKPVHFTLKLLDFPNGLHGSPELDKMALWSPSPKSSNKAPDKDVPEKRLMLPLEPGERGSVFKAPAGGRRAGDSVARPSYPRSSASKEVGDRGEELVYEYLGTARGAKEFDVAGALSWPARDAPGNNCGYDIEFRNSKNELVAIEVKSTISANGMRQFEITSNEWGAAKRIGEGYVLVTVSDVFNRPRFEKFRNPSQHPLLSDRKPSRFTIKRVIDS